MLIIQTPCIQVLQDAIYSQSYSVDPSIPEIRMPSQKDKKKKDGIQILILQDIYGVGSSKVEKKNKC